MFRLFATAALSGASALAAALGTPLPVGADAQVLEKIPRAALADDVGEMPNAMSASARDTAAVLALGERYLDLAARTADERYIGYAEQMLSAIPRAGRPVALDLLQAQLRQRQHDFDGARTEVASVLRREPRNGDAHLLLAYIDMAQGEPLRARGHCLAALLSDPFAAAHCKARTQSLLGGNVEAAQQLQHLATRADLAPAQRRDVLLTLAEIAERDDRDNDAETFLRDILHGDSEQALARLRLADIYRRRERWDDCLRLTADTAQPALLLRRAIAAQALRSDEVAVLKRRLQRYFLIELMRNENYASRDYALYLLQIEREPQRALQVMQSVWRTQREPDDALLLLQAARAAGNHTVPEVVAWRQRTQVQDVRIAREAHAPVSRS